MAVFVLAGKKAKRLNTQIHSTGVFVIGSPGILDFSDPNQSALLALIMDESAVISSSAANGALDFSYISQSGLLPLIID